MPMTFLINKLMLQISFFIVLGLTLVFFIVVAAVWYAKKHQKPNAYKYKYYKKIYSLVFDRDFYLINNFLFKIDDKSYARIDHIVFADKYIYLISDYEYPGDLKGKGLDKSLILQNREGKRFYTDNPVQISKRLLNALSITTGLDPELFIGISVVGNDTHCYLELDSKQFYLIQIDKLSKLIKAIEKRPIANLNEKELDRAVQTLAKMNVKKAN